MLLSAYAGAGELAQGLGGRIPELGDWIANVIGAGLGVVVVMLGAELVRRLRAPRVPRVGVPERLP